MALDATASLRWLRIRKVLHSDWDPIGAGCPEDEYDAYIGPIAALLDSGASDQELMAYLREVETVDMCLSPQPVLDLKRVVVTLRTMDTEGT